VELAELPASPGLADADFDPAPARRGPRREAGDSVVTVTNLFPQTALPGLHQAFESWAERAACQGRTELFFPPHGERPEPRQRREQEARSICRACPVLEACRLEARQQREYGFWGGESEEERAAAGYPVALPVGRVARHIQALKAATYTGQRSSGRRTAG
jgi:WhiB family transcriptional regulator, redox-sensing transcriptional regulator